ncbi:MAG TPA: glycosyltransferase family 2 protein [Vicinamibacterales bacterium]|nr:glycosyltransferase family 2 protein [Vicinamibacterales bacterium]
MVLLDVLVPTRNRARLLKRALESLLQAPVPAGLGVNIVAIDNGSVDGTPWLLEWMAARHRGRIQVVSERRCGKSRALNAGIAATSGDLIGMIDDDEEIDPGWYGEVLQAFTQRPELDFIGGPYVPVWAEPPPDWIPGDYLAVLGDVGAGVEEQPFGPTFPGILKGGNAVIRRRTLLRVGPYAEHLGPAGAARLLSCEDEEMYQRLLKAGACGRYLPSLKVHHHVCATRLTPGYFRRWCFWRGVSRGLMDRAHPLPVRYLAGVPRFLFGSAARGLGQLLARTGRTTRNQSLSDELKLWDLAGYLWGRHIYTLARFSPVRSRRSASAHFPQIIDTSAVSSGDDAWNPSCYFDRRHGSEGARDHHQTCRFCMVEHRRASSPTV